ncbi:MAG: hypothetical protein COT84_01140 [Chlamydiae bacterium CG10_big_fil_rev_8_21_14_0_10_35_9]|nr:MAG: hypothetical protein COT84_01140 [Chlamydiae bacterium CG10_big_fil_rev_8_21_14_0_10_35_9]
MSIITAIKSGFKAGVSSWRATGRMPSPFGQAIRNIVLLDGKGIKNPMHGWHATSLSRIQEAIKNGGFAPGPDLFFAFNPEDAAHFAKGDSGKVVMLKVVGEMDDVDRNEFEHCYFRSGRKGLVHIVEAYEMSSEFKNHRLPPLSSRFQAATSIFWETIKSTVNSQ